MTIKNGDMPAYEVGDKVFNVNYLPYIGNARKFLKINMQPIQTVAAVDICTPWLDKRNAPCFSVAFKDIKAALQAPCNKSHIFYQSNGADVNGAGNRLLCFRSGFDEIQKVIDSDVQLKVDASRGALNKKIARLNAEINAARYDHDEYVLLCNNHAYALLAQLEEKGDE